MIKIDNVNKYYNKGKANEIHVIDNTSMLLPERGIVCLLGPSGCGKTTLLNAIGGLDSVDSGNIFIDDQQITKATSGKIDTIRNARIGYIFQNFNLLDDKTVFENVAVALRMIGIRNSRMIKERVNYCLEKVGIYQYRNRLTSALSGGQRQRVAIARAIVKNPRIIIADEPTGNLDSANTLEIMNIIKSISRERLVILVTHEKKIAEFYSDHVAEMKDGKIIKAYNNDSSRFLDYQLENKIYLKDLPVKKEFSEDDVDIKVYSEEERQANITFVIRGNNLYIDTGGRLNVVDETSNVEMIDDHYTKMDETFFKGADFDYGAHLPKNYKAKYSSIYRFSNLISSGWKTVKGFKKVRKFLMIGFVFAAMFTFLAVSNARGIFDVQPEDYRTTNGNYITVANPEKSNNLMQSVEALEEVSYIIPSNTVKGINFPMDDYLQTSTAYAYLKVSLAKTEVLKEEDLIYGSMPESSREVVVDKLVCDRFIKEQLGKSIGIDDPEKFLGRRLSVRNLEDFRIVGISDTHSPSMFVDDSQLVYILANADSDVEEDYEFGMMEEEEDTSDDPVKSGQVRSINLAQSRLAITKGKKPESMYEVLINKEHAEEYAIGRTVPVRMAGHKLKVVGYYSSDNASEDTYYVADETIRQDFIRKQKEFTVYADDLDEAKRVIEAHGVKCKINDTRDKKAYIHERRSQLTSALLVAGIILLVSLVEMFLMLRSSFLSRIKEVGTLRAIGLKKRDIYRMFTGEILVITVITAVPGIALMYYLLSNIVKISDFFEGMYMITPLTAVISLAIGLFFNLIAGLIPVFFTMRKTPAQILSRTDI
ncbi:MAG: ABC transporter ATP-binding protein/permease [Clostridiales bacterium]|nr:ABC transporter ATP-binding protein/permease [Clostridiales bacterium]